MTDYNYKRELRSCGEASCPSLNRDRWWVFVAPDGRCLGTCPYCGRTLSPLATCAAVEAHEMKRDRLAEYDAIQRAGGRA